MSESDRKTLALLYEAASRKDWDGALDAMHPNVEWKTQVAGTHHGLEAVRRFVSDMTAAFEEVAFEPEQFFEDGDQIVVFVRFSARPPGSEAVIENRIGHLWTMSRREGRSPRELSEARGCPRSRRAFGVGDVAGERGDCAKRPRGNKPWGLGGRPSERCSRLRVRPDPVGMDQGTFDRAGWQRLAEEFTGSWERVIYQADEFIDAGEHVVTPFTNRHTGRDGIEVQARGVWLWTFTDGVLTRVTLYQERQEALDAAGLSE